MIEKEIKTLKGDNKMDTIKIVRVASAKCWTVKVNDDSNDMELRMSDEKIRKMVVGREYKVNAKITKWGSRFYVDLSGDITLIKDKIIDNKKITKPVLLVSSYKRKVDLHLATEEDFYFGSDFY